MGPLNQFTIKLHCKSKRVGIKMKTASPTGSEEGYMHGYVKAYVRIWYLSYVSNP